MKFIENFNRSYAITRNGDVHSFIKLGNKPTIVTNSQRILKPVLDVTGYYIVSLVTPLTKRNYSIHRLLAEAYIPNPYNQPHVNHKDLDKLNNVLSNLEWVSSRQNTLHGIHFGGRDLSMQTTNKVIEQYTVDGVYIATHKSLHEAGRVTGTAYQNIHKVCKALRNTAGGFHWKFK